MLAAGERLPCRRRHAAAHKPRAYPRSRRSLPVLARISSKGFRHRSVTGRLSPSQCATLFSRPGIRLDPCRCATSSDRQDHHHCSRCTPLLAAGSIGRRLSCGHRCIAVHACCWRSAWVLCQSASASSWRSLTLRRPQQAVGQWLLPQPRVRAACPLKCCASMRRQQAAKAFGSPRHG